MKKFSVFLAVCAFVFLFFNRVSATVIVDYSDATGTTMVYTENDPSGYCEDHGYFGGTGYKEAVCSNPGDTEIPLLGYYAGYLKTTTGTVATTTYTWTVDYEWAKKTSNTSTIVVYVNNATSSIIELTNVNLNVGTSTFSVDVTGTSTYTFKIIKRFYQREQGENDSILGVKNIRLTHDDGLICFKTPMNVTTTVIMNGLDYTIQFAIEALFFIAAAALIIWFLWRK